VSSITRSFGAAKDVARDVAAMPARRIVEARRQGKSRSGRST
jgi:hypothetical protein